MSKRATKPNTYSVVDMYAHYVNGLLQDNANYIAKRLSNNGKVTRFTEVYRSSDKELEYLNLSIDKNKEEYYDLLEREKTPEITADISDLEIAIKSFESRKKEILNKEIKEIHKIIDYKLFKNVISSYNTRAGERIINGEWLDLLNGLGYLAAKRVERNPNNRSIDRKETNKLKEENGGILPVKNGKTIYVYHNDDDWVRTWWKKVRGISNISVYSFIPSGGQTGKGFRQAFSKANMDNPLLRLLYPYFPYIPSKSESK